MENGIYTDLIVQKEREKNENKALCEMMDRSSVSGPVIVLADRNYGALNNLPHLENRRWNYVIRLKERGSVFGVQLPDHPMFDVPVALTLGRTSKRQLEKAGASVPENYYHITSQRTFDFLAVGSTEFCTLHFRIVRIEIGDGKTETLVTNLDAQKFPPDELKGLYAKCWGIKTSFRSLKYTVSLIHLHSKIPALILQEIFVAFLIFNFTKAVSWGIETPQEPHKRRQRLNFSDAVFRRSVKNLEALLRRKRFPVRFGRTFTRRFPSGNHISCFYLSSR